MDLLSPHLPHLRHEASNGSKSVRKACALSLCACVHRRPGLLVSLYLPRLAARAAINTMDLHLISYLDFVGIGALSPIPCAEVIVDIVPDYRMTARMTISTGYLLWPWDLKTPAKWLTTTTSHHGSSPSTR